MRVLLVVLVIGCDSGRPPDPKPEASGSAPTSGSKIDPATAVAPDAPPRVLGPDHSIPGVEFNCSAIAPKQAARSCGTIAAPVKTLVAVAAENSHVIGMHESEVKAKHWKRALGAVDAIAKVDPASLATPVRIVVQNALLRISFDARGETELVAAAKREGARFGLPASELAKLGTEPATLEEWLGPAAQWKHRELGGVLSMHAAIGPHAHYRMVQGTARAVAHQLVAIDTDGKPHVTPVVGELELRASDADDAVACVAKIDVERVCGTSPGLVPIDAAEHGTTHFLSKEANGGVGCNGCHTSSTFPVLAADNVEAHDEREVAATILRVNELLE